MNKQIKTNDCNEIFSPVEHAFICDWLDIERPDCASDIELEDCYYEVANYGTRLQRKSEHPGPELDLSIKNAVARLVLSGIQERLPSWTAIDKSGKFISARKILPGSQSTLDLKPQFLFMINWADSGPGFSWPEAYHATYLPVYDIYVVTLSQDSTDAYGYEDLAMGWFRSDEDILSGSHRIITQEWKRQYDEYEQLRWEYLFNAGLVEDQTAQQWAEEVWAEEIEEDEAEENVNETV